MHPIHTKANKIVNKIVDSMVTSILTELANKQENENAIENVWNDAYYKVIDGEYWHEKYGLYGEEVEAVIRMKKDEIIKKVQKRLK